MNNWIEIDINDITENNFNDVLVVDFKERSVYDLDDAAIKDIMFGNDDIKFFVECENNDWHKLKYMV